MSSKWMDLFFNQASPVQCCLAVWMWLRLEKIDEQDGKCLLFTIELFQKFQQPIKPVPSHVQALHNYHLFL